MSGLRTIPVYDERRGRFAALRDQRVLVYWPHGFGDFVHFGYVVPTLDPSNRYYITRFGDDFVHLFDEADGIAPLYSGRSAIDDGGALGSRHLGVNWKKIRNGPMEVMFPEPLATRVREVGVTAMLYSDYPEYEGKRAFPFHTKARALIETLVAPERLRGMRLDAPLRSALRFDVPQPARARIESRLRDIVAPGEHLYLLAPGGHTNLKKAWPRDAVDTFASTVRSFDPVGRVLVIDEGALRERFGDLDAPFAHVLVTLIRACHAFVGVGAGPLHAALAAGVSPVVGIWLAHHPDWYDEPHANSLHLTGPYVHAHKLDRRPATISKPPEFRARVLPFPQRVPHAQDVFEALALLR